MRWRAETTRGVCTGTRLREGRRRGASAAGTETESKSGHVDGAVAAGERVAREIESARALRDEDRGNEGKEEL